MNEKQSSRLNSVGCKSNADRKGHDESRWPQPDIQESKAIPFDLVRAGELTQGKGTLKVKCGDGADRKKTRIFRWVSAHTLELAERREGWGSRYKSPRRAGAGNQHEARRGRGDVGGMGQWHPHAGLLAGDLGDRG